MTVFIQTQANINKMYEIVKKNEVNKLVIKEDKNKKKPNDNQSEELIGLEIMNDKLNIFNEFI